MKKKKKFKNAHSLIPTGLPSPRFPDLWPEQADRKQKDSNEKKKKITIFRLAPRRSKVQFRRNDNGGGQRAELNTSTHPSRKDNSALPALGTGQTANTVSLPKQEKKTPPARRHAVYEKMERASL